MNTRQMGQCVKERRKVLRISQRDLSEISGVSTHALSDVESGKGNPTVKVLNQIFDALGMELVVTIIGSRQR